MDNNFVDAVIQLPPDLFFGTSISTCLVILKKSKKDNATLFVDASAQFVRGGNKNKLSQANQDKILGAFTGREDIEYFARLVPNDEISQNDYNMAVKPTPHSNWRYCQRYRRKWKMINQEES